MAKIIKNNIPYTSIPSSASMLPYDNYDSGLEATNVKDAIDELAEGGGGATALDNLTDVDISSASNGQVLTYSNGEWINNNVPSPSVALNDITDVSVSSPSDGQVLKYNNGDWVNAAESGGTTVIANPSGSSSADLTKLQVDNTIYAIPSGGSDVSVTQIQSAGTKIATITVDSVDTDLYAPNGGSASSLNDLTDVTITSISDGQVIVWDSVSNKWVNTTLGDGTSGFTKTTLYSNTGTLESVIQLSQSMQNFDLIEIVANYPYNDSNVYYQNAIYTSAELINSIGQTNPVNWHIGNDSVYVWVIATDVDEFTVHTVSAGLTVGVRYVYGYKFNGGGSGASALEDLSDVSISSVTSGQVLKYDGTDWVNASESGGGHTILNDSGTSLTQQPNLQFKGAYSEDNDTDSVTEVNVIRKMTKAQFNSLSADEKVGLIHITDESDVAPLADLPDVNLTSPTNGQVLKYNSTSSKWENANESGGGSGGHTIVDEDGTSLTQRTNLQFNGAYLEDNSTDDTTEVNVVRSMTRAEFDQLSANEKQGIIEITDEAGNGVYHEYSTTEQIVGKWVDGSTLYEKSYTVAQLPAVQDNVDISYNITNLGEVVSLSGIMINSTSHISIMLPYTVSSEYSVLLTAYETYIRIGVNSDRSAFKAIVTIRYTKSSS